MATARGLESAHDAIRNVLGRYSRAVDDRDFEAVGRCFTADAVASYKGQVLPRGRDHVVDYLRRVARTMATQHFVIPIVVEVHDDTAESLSYGLAILIQDTDGETRAVARGLRYADRWRLTDEGWQIAERVHTAAWSWQLPAVVNPDAS